LFKHVNSFTATCALPVHNVAAEGTRYDPTCKAHTHMADDCVLVIVISLAIIGIGIGIAP